MLAQTASDITKGIGANSVAKAQRENNTEGSRLTAQFKNVAQEKPKTFYRYFLNILTRCKIRDACTVI